MVCIWQAFLPWTWSCPYHLGFCDKYHSTKGEKNRNQTFYEIAIDHELFSAEAAENIYYEALEKIGKSLNKKPQPNWAFELNEVVAFAFTLNDLILPK
jgi:hypothetical protein